MKKRVLSVFLSVALILGLLPGTAWAAGVTSGSCGTNTTWSFNESTGKLTISGTGATDDYAYSWGSNAPWAAYQSKIKSVYIESGVTRIGEGAFGGDMWANCYENLVAVTLPNTLESIGTYAFAGSPLTSINLPSNLRTIEDCAFNYTNLATISLPSSLTTIGSAAFPDTLKSVRIPASVTQIGSGAFGNYTFITVDTGNRSYVAEDNVLYNIGKTEIICVGSLNATYTIPATVKTVDLSEFWYVPSLEKIIIPAGVELTNYFGPPEGFAPDASQNLALYFYGNAPSELDNGVGTLRNGEWACLNIYYVLGTSGWEEYLQKDYSDPFGVPYMKFALWTPGDATSPAIPEQKTGTFMYDSMLTEKMETYSYFYDETWFFKTGYQHELAQMSIRLAMAAASTSPTYVKDLYNQLGFKYTDKSINYPTPTTDSIGYAIGSKQIIDNNNEVATLIVIAVRGGGYEQEWASNVTLGTTSEHAGFADAANTVAAAVQNYIQSIGAKNNIKIWITGYSRAAATSNIAAQRFNAWANSGFVPGVSADNIFAYCFECPRTVMTNDPSYAAKKYDNIFNIVNYIDIVPKVAPEAWGYDRYGITYYVPSAEQTAKFSGAFEKMLYSYSKIANAAGIQDGGSAAIKSAAYFKGQGAFFDKAVNKLASFFGSPFTYTVGYQDTLRSSMKKINGGSSDVGTAFNLLIEGIPAFAVLHPIIFTKLVANVGNLKRAHYPELCLAWMDSLSGKSEFVNSRTRQLRVNCPVDITVYNSEGILVVQISNDQVAEIEDSTIAAFIDEDEQKVIVLPVDDEFTVNVKATDDGTVTYTATEYNIDSGTTEKVISYYEVDVAENDTLVGLVENLNEVSSAQYPLYLNGVDEALSPSIEQSGSAVQEFSVEVSKSGNGTVHGGGSYVSGEFVKVTATANSGESFLGWYVDNKLVSSDAEYRFLVNKNINITAKFTENIPTTPETPSNPNRPVNPNPNYPSNGGGGITSATNEIAVPSTTGGTVTVSPKSASKGNTITITAIPDSEYELVSLTVTGADGTNIDVSNAGDGKYTFTMPSGKVTVNAVFSKTWSNPFSDVDESAWYYDAVKFANQNGLMDGVGNGLFAPNANLSRAMLAQILYNKEERPVVTTTSSFSDVVAEAWYANAVTWAATKNIVGGYGNGLFGPSDDITREQFAVILYRYAGSPVPPNLLLDFTDAYKVSGWAQDAIRWAVDQGILNGKGNGILDPTGKATRAEAAQMLKNYFGK